MNFSSSLMSGMGISLGGLEIATDYLFANPDFYEPELTEIKTTLSNKPQKSISKTIKSVKPKVTRQSIINKFNIIQDKPSIITDEVIENSNIVNNSDDFDFSFDEDKRQDTVDTKSVDIESTELLEANLLMQRLSEVGSIDSITDDDIDTENIEDEIEIDDSEEDIDSLIDDIDDNSEEDIDSLIDDINIEEDIEDIDNDANDDDTDGFTLDDLDSTDFDLDETEEVEETIQKPRKSIFTDDEDTQDDKLSDEDEDGFTLDELDDNIDIDEDEESNTEDAIEIEDETEEDVINTRPIIKEHRENINNTHDNEEINRLKTKVANMEKEMQKIAMNSASKNTSKINDVIDNKNKKDNLDDLIDTQKKQKILSTTEGIYDKYTVMTIDELYKHVKVFMIKLGVAKRAVDLTALNNKFGEANIRKLIQKSYLIKIGKGVTTGR